MPTESDPQYAPIQTSYMGYKFRSRLEARWAVFFETCGMKWEYEKEGFHLPTQDYLPDFFISNLKMWVEIKPSDFSYETRDLVEIPPSERRPKGFKYFRFPIRELMNDLFEHTDYPVLLIEGVPGDEWMTFWCDEINDGGGGRIECEDVEWVSCNGIITLDLKRGRDHTVYTADMNEELPWFTYYQSYPTFQTPIKIAYQAARSARFEHGENRYIHTA